jgi:hypothetical protein
MVILFNRCLLGEEDNVKFDAAHQVAMQLQIDTNVRASITNEDREINFQPLSVAY